MKDTDLRFLFSGESLAHFDNYAAVKSFLNLLMLHFDVLKPITIFPDAVVKSWGFPSGIILKVDAQGLLFPVAVADLGCGFRLIKTNIYRGDLNRGIGKLLSEKLDKYAGEASEYRKNLARQLNLTAIFQRGVEYLLQDVQVGLKTDPARIQNGGHFADAEIDIDPEDERNMLEDFGRCAGHFFEARYVGEIYDRGVADYYDLHEDQVVLVIHAGSMSGRDAIVKNYFPAAIEYTLNHLETTVELLEQGLFGVPWQSAEGQRYLQAVRAIFNYSYAGRHFAQPLILKAFREVFGEWVEFELLTDICHSKLEVWGEGSLVHLRGLQNIYPAGHEQALPFCKSTGDLALIGGQKGMSSHLVIPTENIQSTEYLCCHGSGEFSDPQELVPAWAVREVERCYFNTEYNQAEELQNEYNSVMTSLRVLADDLQIVSRVARLAPFLNYWGEK